MIAALVVVWLNRKTMFTLKGATTEVLTPGDDDSDEPSDLRSVRHHASVYGGFGWFRTRRCVARTRPSRSQGQSTPPVKC